MYQHEAQLVTQRAIAFVFEGVLGYNYWLDWIPVHCRM
jgi:hypothetical protein